MLCAMIVIVVVIVVVAVIMTVMMLVVVIMVVIVAFEEVRLDVEDAVEVEGVAAENLVERDLGALRSCAAWRKG